MKPRAHRTASIAAQTRRWVGRAPSRDAPADGRGASVTARGGAHRDERRDRSDRAPLGPAAAGLLLLLFPALAVASPWTLRRGELAVVTRFEVAQAEEEFLDEGGSRPYPLDGRFAATSVTFGARFGITDRLELEASLPIKQVTYTSDPVILLAADPAAGDPFDFYQENVLDLSRAEVGPADLELAARYQLLGGRLAIAVEGRLKAPTGYDKPAGTFGDRPKTREAFVAGIGDYVRPENVRDDVTLGDGQLDLGGALLVGWALPFGSFIRLDGGYRLRFGGAADEATFALRLGHLILGRVLPYAGIQGEVAVTQGDVIGVSVAADDPELPATEYAGTKNLDLREVRLEKDELLLPVGVIFRLTDAVELNLGHSRTLWGRNTGELRTWSLGLGVRTQAVP